MLKSIFFSGKALIVLFLICLPIAIIAQPTISSFSPTSGTIGTLVTIKGSNLSNPTAFSIGGIAALVISNNGDTLVGMVMPGATIGKVSIINAGGTINSIDNFTVTPSQVPNAQQGSKLVGTDSSNGSWQGHSVALSADGNTALIGGYGDQSGIGCAYVYIRNGSVWNQQGGKLVGNDYIGVSYQGSSVSLSADGNTALVGGSGDNSQGAAWVFTRSGNIWTQQGSKLVGTGAIGNADQGWSVALSVDGNTAIVGGYADNNGIGATWVFTRTGSTWAQQGTKLVGSGNVGASQQGISVSLSEDGTTLIIGGFSDNGAIGAAWVFTKSGNNWSQQGNKLIGTGYIGQPAQGQSVSVSADGNTAVVGGYNDNSIIGAVWVFTRIGSSWTQQGKKIVGSGYVGYASQGFSTCLSADGNTIIVGGYGDNYYTGATWIFSRTGNFWSQNGVKLVGTGYSGNTVQGYSVSISADGKTSLIGGVQDNVNIGAAWVFTALPIPLATNAASINLTGFTANWNASEGATGYFLDVASDSTFTNLINNNGLGNEDVGLVLTKTVTGLSPATKYYYRVRGYTANGPGGNSNIISVTTLKAQTITFGSLSSKTYGDASFTASASGGASGNPVIFSSSDSTVAKCSGTNGSLITILKAGSCFVYANQAGNSIYGDAIQVQQTLLINPKSITVSVDSGQGKIYSSADPAYTYKVSPALITSDIFSGSLSRNPGENVGSYIINQGSLTGGANYSISFVSDSFSISRKPVSIVGTISKTYDGTKFASITNASIIGKVGADDVSLSLPIIGTFALQNVDTGILISAQPILIGTMAENYYLATTSFKGSITPAPVTITANNFSRKYFAPEPSFTVNYSGFVNGETNSVLTKLITVSTDATKTSLPGDYTITASGAESSNYTFTYNPGTLTINPSTIQICIVTVDLQTGDNMIVWEPDRNSGIKEYNIYKQGNQAGVYKKLLSPVPVDSAGLFIDTSSRIINHADYYKITATDSLGNESSLDLSNYHKTMFLQYNGNNQGVNLIWSSYEINNSPLNFSSYVIYRGTDSTALVVVDTVAANINQYTDNSPQSQLYRTYYRIGGILLNGCDPTVKGPKGKKSYSTSISNIENNRVNARAGGSAVNKVFENSLNLNIYPNPGKGDVTISYTLQTAADVRLVVTDLTGKEVAIIEKSKQPVGESMLQLNTDEFGGSSSVYFIKLIIGKNIITRKLVVVK